MYFKEDKIIEQQNIYWKESIINSTFLKKIQNLGLETWNSFYHSGVPLTINFDKNNLELFGCDSKENVQDFDLVALSEVEFYFLLEKMTTLELKDIFAVKELSWENKEKIFYFNYRFKDVEAKIAFWEKVLEDCTATGEFITEIIRKIIGEEFTTCALKYYYNLDEEGLSEQLYYLTFNELHDFVPNINLKSPYFEFFVRNQLSEYYHYKPEKSRLDLIWFGYKFNQANKNKRLEVIREILEHLYILRPPVIPPVEPPVEEPEEPIEKPTEEEKKKEKSGLSFILSKLKSFSKNK